MERFDCTQFEFMSSWCLCWQLWRCYAQKSSLSIAEHVIACWVESFLGFLSSSLLILNAFTQKRGMIFSIVKITLILNLNINTICRSSRLEVFCKNVVPENFLKFTGKHLCQSLFFNKVAGLQPFKYLRWYGLLTQLY